MEEAAAGSAVPPLVPDRESCSVGWRRTRSDTGGIHEYRASSVRCAPARQPAAGGLAIISGADAQTAKYKEPPALAEQVKAGKLPAVDQRLPENPLVVPGESRPVRRRCGAAVSWGPRTSTASRVVYDVLARFGPDGATIEMKLAESASPRISRLDRQAAQGRPSGRTARPSPPTTSCTGTRTCCRTRTSCQPVPSWMLNKDGTPSWSEKVDRLRQVDLQGPQDQLPAGADHQG